MSLEQINLTVGEIKADLRNIAKSQERIEAALCSHVKEDEARLGVLEAAHAKVRALAWVTTGIVGIASTVGGWLWVGGPRG